MRSEKKTSPLDLGLEQEWACYGIPLQLFLDNAWAHHSHSLENLARVISRNRTYNSIYLMFRPPYKGRYGAIIERLFKNFSGQIKELVKGAIASGDPKEIRAAAKNACLLYPDMNRLLHQLILKYQHTAHRELGGMTPHQKWSEGIESSGFPLPPPFTPAMDRLFMRLHPQPRQVRSRGIPAFGLNYWSAELGGIEHIDREGKAIQYHFRYDPTDISRISLFRNGEWIGNGYARELQQADGTYRQIWLSGRRRSVLSIPKRIRRKAKHQQNWLWSVTCKRSPKSEPRRKRQRRGIKPPQSVEEINGRIAPERDSRRRNRASPTLLAGVRRDE